MYLGEKYDSADIALLSSSNIPYTVEPEPDRLANRDPQDSSFFFIFPISGYAGTTIDSKSFSKTQTGLCPYLKSRQN
ncbi:hypothetical protein Ct9H90mP29_04860 [bacterium]|nr:MAG: hypothetical protein Ct9H90mP29_04860 [bacterium]